MLTLKINIPSGDVRARLEGGHDEIELTVLVASPPPSARSTVPSSLPRGPLAPLLNSGMLRAGQRLHLDQPRARRTAVAVVQPSGALRIEGKTRSYTSPSGAASAVTGTSINGWKLWCTDKGETLGGLRSKLKGTS
jgi:site-specific DNA-methyltransferase (adenine-specific)